MKGAFSNKKEFHHSDQKNIRFISFFYVVICIKKKGQN